MFTLRLYGKVDPRVSCVVQNPRPQEISQDFPRALPSGNLSVVSGNVGRRGWISQYLPHLGGARIQCINRGAVFNILQCCPRAAGLGARGEYVPFSEKRGGVYWDQTFFTLSLPGFKRIF